MVVLHPLDAADRLLNEGELAWVYGPRRHELAEVRLDDKLKQGRRRPSRRRRIVAVGDHPRDQTGHGPARTPGRAGLAGLVGEHWTFPAVTGELSWP